MGCQCCMRPCADERSNRTIANRTRSDIVIDQRRPKMLCLQQLIVLKWSAPAPPRLKCIEHLIFVCPYTVPFPAPLVDHQLTMDPWCTSRSIGQADLPDSRRISPGSKSTGTATKSTAATSTARKSEIYFDTKTLEEVKAEVNG